PPGGLLLVYQVGAEASPLFVVPRAPAAARALALAIPPAAAAVLGVAPGPLTRDALRRILGGGEGGEKDGGLAAALGESPRGRAPAPRAPLASRLHDLCHAVVA